MVSNARTFFPSSFTKPPSIISWNNNLLVEPDEVNQVKKFSGPYYMIKRVLTFLSDVQEYVLLDFINQNKVKILNEVKTCQNCVHQKFPYKN